MLYIKNDFDIRTAALHEAVRLSGSAINLCLAIKTNPASLSKWISNPLIKIPYDTILKIEEATGVNVEKLMPQKKETNAYIENRMLGKLILRNIPIKAIITNNSVSLPFSQPNQLIIIGTDGILISGLAILNAYYGIKVNAKVLVLDLHALLNGSTSIMLMLRKLLISECIAIGLRLEQLISNHQGKNTTNFVAKIIEYKEDTYIKAKQIYLSQNQELINKVNNQAISITEAEKLISNH